MAQRHRTRRHKMFFVALYLSEHREDLKERPIRKDGICSNGVNSYNRDLIRSDALHI